MIKSTNTLDIDGIVLNENDFSKIFSISKDDKFSNWVIKPLALLTVAGMGIAMFFASAFFIMLALAVAPLILLSGWAMKTKIERDLANADPVVSTMEENEAHL